MKLPEFSAGCRLGAIVLAVALVAAAAWRKAGRSGPLPIGGVLIAVAFVAAMRWTGRLVPGMAVGLALLAVAGVASENTGRRPLVLAVLAVPGAWVLATQAGLGNVTWARALVAAAVIVGAPLAADLDARAGPDALGPVLFVVSAIGVYFTIPDTDVALALVPIAALVALSAWPVPLVTLGPGSAPAVGAIAWASAVGGLGRPTAVIGGVAALGLLVAEPLGRIVARRRHGALGGARHGPAYVVAVAAVQLVVVYIASRVAGTRLSTRTAATVAALDLGVAAAVAAAIAGRRRRRLHAPASRRRTARPKALTILPRARG